jgi:glutathione S-transferase
VAVRHNPSGSLPALVLGVAALVASPALRSQAAPEPAEKLPLEIVISAERERDAALAAKVEQALQNDPYLFTDHISVSAEHGVVRLEGFVTDPFEMRQLLRIARRAAGKRRVINEIEFVDPGVDHD